MYYLTRNQRDHTCRKRTCLLPAFAHVMLHFKSWGCSKNRGFRGFAHHHKNEPVTGISRTAGAAGHCKVVHNRKAICCTLLKRITKLKCVNSEFNSFDINPTQEVPSNGSMAPCRSHHGSHTRQEWIIIWSGRNWILENANQSRSLDIKRVTWGTSDWGS